MDSNMISGDRQIDDAAADTKNDVVDINLEEMNINELPKVCSPITSISKLYECLRSPPEWSDSIIELTNRSDTVVKNSYEDCHTENYNFFPKERLKKNLQPKTLICHDMKNGYLEDKFTGPVPVGNGYTFYRWSQIDMFVYFSHHLITIPPLAWINVAHQNGVPILGTFITEWNPGKEICNEILRDTESIKTTVNALIDICLLFKLDGWLINIENTVDETENLKLFVKYLTDGLHEKQKNSYVIWYDSVIKTGELRWQNELNQFNRGYFDVCDGIFLNYNWTEKHLERTVKEAGHRILDVYVGLDVFGRGSFGGGKFNSHIAAEAVRKHNLSLAIFAPGWTHETLDKEPEHDFLERFHRRDNNFWNMLWPYLYVHPIKYAFETIFHTGTDVNLYDLRSQTCHITNFMSCNCTESTNLTRIKDICKCLLDNIKDSIRICHISNEHIKEEQSSPYIHRLFSTEIFLNGDFIFYCYTNVTDVHYQLVLLVQDQYQRINKIVCHSNPESGIIDEHLVHIKPSVNGPHYRKSNIPKIWDFRAFEVSFNEDTLLEIGFSIIGKDSIDLCAFGITTKD